MSDQQRGVYQNNDKITSRDRDQMEKPSATQQPMVRQNINTEKPEDKSFSNLIKQAGDSNIGPLLEKLQPVIDSITNYFSIVFPYVSHASEKIYNFYNSLPLDIIYAIVGLLLVFFGGVYCLLIAAIETFYMTGYKQVKEGVLVLKEEFELIWKESKKDNEVDEDHDGIADVKQMTIKELALRKFLLFMQTCRDPQRVMNILTTIMTSFISVIAVLKVEFAKVIALGNMIGEALKRPANYLLVPSLACVIPPKFQKWIPALIELACKFVAITIAWIIQRVISSVQSAIRGGLLFSRRILNFLKEKGIFTSYSEEDYYDEALGWFVALFGIYFQLSYGFEIPFLLKLFLFPLSWIESYLVWNVSS